MYGFLYLGYALRFTFSIFLGCCAPGTEALAGPTSRLPRLSRSLRISRAFSEAKDSTWRHAASSNAQPNMMFSIARAVCCCAERPAELPAELPASAPLAPLAPLAADVACTFMLLWFGRASHAAYIASFVFTAGM